MINVLFVEFCVTQTFFIIKLRMKQPFETLHRSGVALKKVDAESEKSSSSDQNGSAYSGIAGMLQRALHERSAAICPSSSDDDEAPEDDDEWDD